MPSPQEEVKEVRGTQNPNPTIQPTQGSATISAPPLDKDGDAELEAKSVKDASQAWDICKGTETSNMSRAARTSDIQAIYDGIPPRAGSDKLQKGQNWQHNFSTRWLAGIVKPVVMRFVNGVTNQIYLTRSALPPSYPDWKSKSDLFQSKATRLFRLWKGLTPLINRLAVENVLQGYTYSVFLDPSTWKPKAFKQDRAFVPEEAEQDARELQYFVAKQDYILADFIKLFTNEAAAKANGYDIENCNWAAGNAQVKDPREDASTTQFRKFQEMLVDGALGLTYSFSSPLVVKTWILWNQEYDGKISFWILERDSGKLLRYSFKLYKNMTEVLALFTLDPGNGSIHSSLGLGRYLAAQAVVIERHRNRMLDNTMMSGLLILRADPKDRARANTQVTSPFVFLDKSIEIGEQQFSANTEGYVTADNLVTSWAEQIAGVYVQAQLQANGASDKTATEASIDAAREKELGDVVMRRWLDQFSGMIQIMQQRAFRDEVLKEADRIWQKFQDNPDLDLEEMFADSSDPEAVEIVVEMYREGLQMAEIKILRRNPASGFSHVDVAVIQQGINNLSLKYKGDTRLDQNKLLRLDVESEVGPDVARELVVEGEDQSVLQGAQRQQLTETSTMNDLLQQVPVLPSDNHAGHISVLIPILNVLKNDIATPQQNIVALRKVELNLDHLGQHLQAMLVAGDKQNPLYKQASKFYEDMTKNVQQVIEVQAHAQAAEAAVVNRIRAERGAAAAGQIHAHTPVPGSPAPGPGAQPAQPVNPTPPVVPDPTAVPAGAPS